MDVTYIDVGTEFSGVMSMYNCNYITTEVMKVMNVTKVSHAICRGIITVLEITQLRFRHLYIHDGHPNSKSQRIILLLFT